MKNDITILDYIGLYRTMKDYKVLDRTVDYI